MKITRETLITWILGLIVLAIVAALGWRAWQTFREKCVTCYMPSNELPEQSMDHSSLTSKYHALGVISDKAFEKLSASRKDA